MLETRRVLVVEPEDDRGGLTEELREAGLLVESAGDAARAMAGIAANDYAVILVDPSTQNLTAEGLSAAVRQASPRPVVLVLVEDAASVPRRFPADAIHGYVHRSTADELAELVQDTLDALREGAAGSPPAGGAQDDFRIMN